MYQYDEGYRSAYGQVAQAYLAELITKSPNPTIEAGRSTEVRVTLRNAGTATWYNYTTRTPTPASPIVRLGTWNSRDRASAFLVPGGLIHTQSRIEMPVPIIQTGQQVTFAFNFTVPADMPPGVYTEDFLPVAELAQWFPSPVISWDINVVPVTSTGISPLVIVAGLAVIGVIGIAAYEKQKRG